MSQKIKTSVEIDGSLSASQIANATTDTDKFLVSDGGVIKYRTGAELATDLGIAAGVTSKVQHQVKAGVAINKGQAVYVTGADGTNMIVGLASNATEATSSKTMGLLNATVSVNLFADVITEGLLSGLNTSAATVGDPIWLGTDGNLIYGLANKPYAPSHLVFIGIVTRVNANNGEIFINVQNGFELNEIHDVDIKTDVPINGDVLGYNGTLWVNKTIAEWLGFTPVSVSGTGTTNTLPKFTGSTTLGNSSIQDLTTGVLINNSITATSAIARGTNLTPTLVATANNDILVGLDISPTFTNGAFTTVTNASLRLNGTNQGFIFADYVGGNSNYAIYPKTIPNANNFVLRTDSSNTILNAPASNGTLSFRLANTTFAQISPTSGNFILQNGGTFTDAGFRLDVNGTARVQGALTATADSTINGVGIGLGGGLIITNTRIGANALAANTTGANNTAYGRNSLSSNTTGSDNTVIGNGAFQNNTTGSSNTIIGKSSLPNNVLGSGNIAFGFEAGRYVAAGTNNTETNNSIYIGNGTRANAITQTNQIVIGHNAVGLGSNSTRIGNSSTTFTVIEGDLVLGTSSNTGQQLQVVGTTLLNGLTTIQGTTASDTAPLGSELLTTGAGDASWTGTSFATGYTHVAGSVTTLTSAVAAVVSTYYLIQTTVTGRTAGSFTIDFGGSTFSSLSITDIQSLIATTTGNLVITPTSDFNGTIVLSLKQVNTSSASITLNNSSGTPTNAIRISSDARNVFIGSNAGSRNFVGGDNKGIINTFIGGNAGRNNISGRFNTFIGGASGQNNTRGNNNTALGTNSLLSNTISSNNTAIGSASLQNTTGGNNTAVGFQSLLNNTSGISNSAIGVNSLTANTTGAYNTAIGENALTANTTGSSNTSIGLSSLNANTTGSSNTAIGFLSLGNNISGSNNVALGINAARYAGSGTTAMTSVNNSIYLGSLTRGLNATGSTNEIVVGYDVVGLGSNSTRIGNSSTTFTVIEGDLVLGSTTDNGTDKLQVTGSTNITGQLKLGSTITNGTFTYTLPGATGTLALVGGAGVGTVTSVAAITLGTTGTDLSSTVANGTTTPVITLNVPTASATNRGALSAADWTTFNSKSPRYSSSIAVSHSSYTNICTISGDGLASAIKMSFQGTSGGVVVNTTAEILVNHYQDISVTSNSGIYSQLNIRIISDNNASYSIEAQVVGAAQATAINIEIFPLNSESVTFQGTLVTAGTTLVHTTRPGIYISATGGDTGTISSGGNINSGGDVSVAGILNVGSTTNVYPVVQRGSTPSGSQGIVLTAGANKSAAGGGITFADNADSGGTITLVGNSGDIYGGGVNITAYGQYNAANIITFATRSGAGTTAERMRIFSDGNVSLGSSTPTNNGYRFQVNGGQYGTYLKGGDYGTGSTIANFVDAGGTSAMYVRGDNRVGIGTVSPNYKLSVVPLATYGNAEDGNISISASASGGTVSAPTTAGGIVFGDQNVTNGYAGRIAVIQNSPSNSTASQMRFYTNSGGGNNSTAERVRITSAGDVGIGAVSPRVKLDVEAYTAFMSLSSAINSEATTVDQQIGGIDFRKHYALAISGSIRLLQSGGVNNYSQGHLAFYTNDGSTPFGSVPPEKMRITSNGTVLIGATTDAGYKLDVNGKIRSSGGMTIPSTQMYDLTDPNHGMIYNSGVDGPMFRGYGGFTWNTGSSGATQRMYLTPAAGLTVVGLNVTATGFFNSSDNRLKDLTDYDYNVSDIKPITYLWKDLRDNKKHIGYSAQEVQKVMPDAVNEDADGMLSVNYIEVLVAKIAELENRIKQLEK